MYQMSDRCPSSGPLRRLERTEIMSISCTPEDVKSKAAYLSFVALNCIALSIGASAGPLLVRMYFLDGGSHIWFDSFLQTLGFPLALPIIYYLWRKKPGRQHHVDIRLGLMSAGVGVLTGADIFIYSWGMSYLPVSTSQVLISTQLGFTAVFAYVFVRQKFTAFSINSVVLLTLSCVVLGFHSKNDRLNGVTDSEYLLGFLLTVGAAAIYGMLIPLIDLTYRLGQRDVTYTVVMEMQVIMSALATLFLAVGLLASGEYAGIEAEALVFHGGVIKYTMCCLWTAVCWELYYIGIYGVTFQVNSLLSGVIVAAWIPGTEVLAVFFFKESFRVEKGLSLALALWGITSYLYGEYKQVKCEEEEGREKDASSKDPIPLPLPPEW